MGPTRTTNSSCGSIYDGFLNTRANRDCRTRNTLNNLTKKLEVARDREVQLEDESSTRGLRDDFYVCPSIPSLNLNFDELPQRTPLVLSYRLNPEDKSVPRERERSGLEVKAGRGFTLQASELF